MKVQAIHSKKTGEERIHAAGCRDIAREQTHEDKRYPYVFEAESIEDIAAEYCQDFIAEGSWTLEEATEHWMAPACAPCVHLPMWSPKEGS